MVARPSTSSGGCRPLRPATEGSAPSGGFASEASTAFSFRRRRLIAGRNAGKGKYLALSGVNLTLAQVVKFSRHISQPFLP